MKYSKISNRTKKVISVLTDPKRILLHLMNMPMGRLISDEAYVKMMYYANFHKKLNLNEPSTYNEKIQWLKLYDHNPQHTQMVDKVAAKQYAANIIGKDHIVPTLGSWESFDLIDFDSLPNRFVLKCNHDSGGIVVCKDKHNFNIRAARRKLNKHLRRNYYWFGREYPYKNIKPCIFAEQYMEDPKSATDEIIDYKFFCFDGEPHFLYISEGLSDHETASISFLTMDWEFAEFKRKDYRAFSTLPEKPKRYPEMIEMARKLSKGFPFLRVDLYEINGQIFFSELTFSPCSGCVPFEPEEWDAKLGEMLVLPQKPIALKMGGVRLLGNPSFAV